MASVLQSLVERVCFGIPYVIISSHCPSAERSFRKMSRYLKRSFRNFLRNLLRNLPRNSPRKFPVLSWQVEKSSPQISPDFSHRKISNFKPNSTSNFSTKISQTRFCRLGSLNQEYEQAPIWSPLPLAGGERGSGSAAVACRWPC